MHSELRVLNTTSHTKRSRTHLRTLTFLDTTCDQLLYFILLYRPFAIHVTKGLVMIFSIKRIADLLFNTW